MVLSALAYHKMKQQIRDGDQLATPCYMLVNSNGCGTWHGDSYLPHGL